MCAYSHGETSAEFSTDFTLFGRNETHFQAFAHAAGALMPATPAKFVSARHVRLHAKVPLIAASSCTKNDKGESDPEIHQTKKGNQWHLGIKAHIGVDANSGLVHTVTTTAANAHDITQAHALLYGEEEMVFADSGYRGVQKRAEIQEQHPEVDWRIAMMPGQRKTMDKKKPVNLLREQLEKLKASIRAKVEHPFLVIKCQFGHRKARYRGLAKNTSQLLVMFALSNLWMVRKRILQGCRYECACSKGRARKWAPIRKKNEKSAANSALVSSCEYSLINSRCGEAHADYP